jgi:hypothetical protein
MSITCNHWTVDEDQIACDQCIDEFYVGNTFTMNGKEHMVHSYYGISPVTELGVYRCRCINDGSSIYLSTADIDALI